MRVLSSSFFVLLLTCDQDKGVTVFNTPPEAEIISHTNGSEVFEEYAVEFRATRHTLLGDWL